MVRKFGPFDTSSFYEVENRRLQRAFNPNTGFVKAGQGAVTAGTGAQLVIAAYPDGALIDGLYVENPATETVTLTTNSGNTNPRIDRLVMRLDMTAKTIAPFQIVGTPAASPSVPPLVKTDTVVDMPMVRYTMPGSASAQNPGSIVNESMTISQDWQTYTPQWRAEGASVQPSIGNGQLVGRSLRLSQYTGIVKIGLSWGSTTTANQGTGTGSNGWSFSLPPGWVGGSAIASVINGWFINADPASGPLGGLVDLGASKIYPIQAANNNALVGNGLLTAQGNSILLHGLVELA